MPDQLPEAEQAWSDLNVVYLKPRGECSDCDSQFDPDDTFAFRGLHFCPECVSELSSWMLDGGEKEDPDRYNWAGIYPDPEPASHSDEGRPS